MGTEILRKCLIDRDDRAPVTLSIYMTRQALSCRHLPASRSCVVEVSAASCVARNVI